MNTKFILFIIVFILVVHNSFGSRLFNPLVDIQSNMVMTSWAMCDYLMQEGTYPANLNVLIATHDAYPCDYFAREKIIKKDYGTLYYCSMLIIILLAIVLLKVMKKISSVFFVIILTIHLSLVITTVHPDFLLNPARLISMHFVIKTSPHSIFNGVSLDCDVKAGDVFHYGITNDNNAILLSQGPDFITPFSKERIEEIDTNQFMDEIITYSPTNGLQSTGDLWMIVPNNIQNKSELPIPGMYGFVDSKKHQR